MPTMSIRQLQQKLSANLRRWTMIYEPRTLTVVMLTLICCLLFTVALVEQLDASAALPVYVRWCQAVARGSGSLLNFTSCLIMVTSCRTLLTMIFNLIFLRGVDIFRAVKSFHSPIAYAISFFALLHTVAHFIWLLSVNEWWGGLWGIKMTVVTGACLVLPIFILLISSLQKCRVAHHRACKLVHISGSVAYFGCLIMHGVHQGRPQTYKYVIPVLLLYLVDRCLGRYRTVDCTMYISADDIEGVGRGVMRLTMPRPFNFRSGQFIGKIIY